MSGFVWLTTQIAGDILTLLVLMGRQYQG
jgi:hypothetical protein